MANRLVRNKAGLACPCMSNITLTMSGGLAAWRTSRAVGHGGVHGQFQRKHVTNHWKCPHKTMDDKKMKMVTGIAMYTGFCVQINYLREKMNSMGQCLVTCSQRGAECSQRDPFLRTEWPIFLAGACSSLSLPAECESVQHQTGNIAILIQLYKAFANHRWPTPTLPPILPVFQSFHSCWYQFFDLTTKMRRQQKQPYLHKNTKPTKILRNHSRSKNMRSNVEMYMPAKATTAYDLPAHYVPKPLQCSGACAGWNQILFHFFLFYVFLLHA